VCSIRQAIDEVSETLKAHPELYYGHGTENHWDEAVALVLQALALPFSVSDEALARDLTEAESEKLQILLDKRVKDQVPLGYLTKESYFCGLPFYVDERVLIPRSPIAELIEQHFEPWVSHVNVTRVLDMCTGSGCIAIACAYAFEMAGVDAVDIDVDALAVAKMNIDKHDVSKQVTLFESNLFDALPEKPYDIIVSNPPYVSAREMQTLPNEYHHEPRHALEADDEGFALVDRILKQAANYLSDNGILVVEVGNGQDALEAKYPDVPFVWVEFEYGGHGVFVLSRHDLTRHF
jgi:ribosomal protein L3 glutamine methyltransferase